MPTNSNTTRVNPSLIKQSRDGFCLTLYRVTNGGALAILSASRMTVKRVPADYFNYIQALIFDGVVHQPGLYFYDQEARVTDPQSGFLYLRPSWMALIRVYDKHGQLTIADSIVDVEAPQPSRITTWPPRQKPKPSQQ